MKNEPPIGPGLKILDKHAYCRRLIFSIASGETEFMERKFYELCFTLYARFCAEKISPQLIYPYFVLADEAFEQHPDLRTTYIQQLIKLGLQLNDFTHYSENALQLSNIMLQINGLVTQWHQQNHICKYCGHTLDLLTEKINEKDCVLS